MSATDTQPTEVDELKPHELPRGLPTVFLSDEELERARLEARIAALEGALRPFAAAYRRWMDDHAHRHTPINGVIYPRHIIEARALLDGSQGASRSEIKVLPQPDGFFALADANARDVDHARERVPEGTRYAGQLWITPVGEFVLTGSPRDPEGMTVEEAIALHDCDAMGCSSVSHVVARVHREPEAPTSPPPDSAPVPQPTEVDG